MLRFKDSSALNDKNLAHIRIAYLPSLCSLPCISVFPPFSFAISTPCVWSASHPALRLPPLSQLQCYLLTVASSCYQVQVHTTHHTAGQPTHSEVLGPGMATISRRLRNWWTRVPKNHRAQVRIQSFFIPKEEGGVDGCCKLLGGRILCS